MARGVEDAQYPEMMMYIWRHLSPSQRHSSQALSLRLLRAWAIYEAFGYTDTEEYMWRAAYHSIRPGRSAGG
jgi:hypothetical protein